MGYEVPSRLRINNTGDNKTIPLTWFEKTWPFTLPEEFTYVRLKITAGPY